MVSLSPFDKLRVIMAFPLRDVTHTQLRSMMDFRLQPVMRSSMPSHAVCLSQSFAPCDGVSLFLTA